MNSKLPRLCCRFKDSTPLDLSSVHRRQSRRCKKDRWFLVFDTLV